MKVQPATSKQGDHEEEANNPPNPGALVVSYLGLLVFSAVL